MLTQIMGFLWTQFEYDQYDLDNRAKNQEITGTFYVQYMRTNKGPISKKRVVYQIVNEPKLCLCYQLTISVQQMSH